MSGLTGFARIKKGIRLFVRLAILIIENLLILFNKISAVIRINPADPRSYLKEF